MAALPASPAGFSVSVNGVDKAITSVSLNENPSIVELSLNNVILKNATNIVVSNTAGTVAAQDGTTLGSFANKGVTNNSTVVTRNIYSYDDMHRLNTIQLSNGKTLRYRYDIKGNIIGYEILN
jgi:hypothetical protein